MSSVLDPSEDTYSTLEQGVKSQGSGFGVSDQYDGLLLYHEFSQLKLDKSLVKDTNTITDT